MDINAAKQLYASTFSATNKVAHARRAVEKIESITPHKPVQQGQKDEALTYTRQSLSENRIQRVQPLNGSEKTPLNHNNRQAARNTPITIEQSPDIASTLYLSNSGKVEPKPSIDIFV